MNRSKISAKDIVEMLLEDDIEDLALDFIEGAVGRYTFPRSWEKLQPLARKSMAEGWLRGRGDVVTQPDDLVKAVDGVADRGYVWNK